MIAVVFSVSLLGSCPAVAQTDDSLVQSFVRGDYSGDSAVELGDAIGLLGHLFVPGTPEPSCRDAGDLNDDGALTIGDAVHLLSYLFVPGSLGPAAPFPFCGADDSSDSLSCAGLGSFECPLIPIFQFEWPMPGVDTHEWVINNYVDLDPSDESVLDYMGGGKTYDGHRAIDIDVPTFRAMDDDFPILAAAPGVVVATEDSYEDRHMSCYGDWNYVTIEHANGWQTIYGHLKQFSVVVALGETVAAGDVLGVVGSSGCSTAPHLHFEVHDAAGGIIDPFLDGLFANPPVYNTPLGFMDAVIDRGSITTIAEILDPSPNATVVEPGETLGVGLSMAGGAPGDSIQMFLKYPSGVVYSTYNNTFSSVYRHSFWTWNPQIPATAPIGYWELEIRTNGSTVATYPIFVGSVYTGYQQVRHGLPASQYQQEFETLVANGYRPVWVDGYDVLDTPYVNVIFDRSPSAGWLAYHGQSGSSHQSTFDDLTSSGYRLVHIDGYVDNGSLRYATIYEAGPGPGFAAYHAATVSSHQALFNDLTADGFRAKNISFAEIGSTLYVTALYDTAPVGGWVALAGLTAAQYQTEFDAQAAAGRTLSYVNSYEQAGSGRYSAIWDSVNPSSWVGTHGVSSSAFQSEFDTWTGVGLQTRFVTAHWEWVPSGIFSVASARFSGFWSN